MFPVTMSCDRRIAFFFYHLSLVVGPWACIFMKVLVKVKKNYGSRPNLNNTGQYSQDEAPATYPLSESRNVLTNWLFTEL